EPVSTVSAVAAAAARKIQSVSYRRSQLQPSDESSARGQNDHHLSRYRRIPRPSYAVTWAAFRDPSCDSEPDSEGLSPRRDGHMCEPGDARRDCRARFAFAADDSGYREWSRCCDVA